MIKAERLRGLDVADLERQANDAREQLFRLTFQMGMGQFEGLKKYRNTKRDRARMLTVLNEKYRAGETAAAPATKKKGKRK
jgi:large subunit ribosomal protein L29